MAQNPLSLGNYQIWDQSQARLFLQQISVMLNQIYQPSFVSSSLAQTTQSVTALQLLVVQAVSTPTTNQTVDTTKATNVFLQYTWATAANFSVTLNNVTNGQMVMIQIFQNSGAARTLTILANAPGGSAMTVATSSNTLSSGVSIASGVKVTFMGMASSTSLLLTGVGTNW